jgi:predicted O-methyltransferase YrrM
MLRSLRAKYSKHANSLHCTEADAHDACALAQLAPLGGGTLPWTTHSMRPAVIAAVVTDVIVNRRRTIVECGSGNSTVFVARLLAGLGEGRLVSLDHDERWAALTCELLDRDGVGERATVVHAPLAQGWYDLDVVPTVEGIDLLIVDGPPAHTEGQGENRHPALPVFGERLVVGATVLVDDAQRPGEQAIMARWTDEHGIAFSRQRGGYAVGRA